MITSTNSPQVSQYYWDMPLIEVEGYTGESVRLVQRLLEFLGYLPPSSLNAVYNSSTIAAVRKFQTDHKLGYKLTVNGHVDQETWQALTDRLLDYRW